MNDRERRNQNREGAQSDPLPHEPTKEHAAAGGRSEEPPRQRRTAPPEQLGTERREIQDKGTPRRPPHVGSHEADAPVQDEVPSPGAVPVLPANASGDDTTSPDQQDQPMDPESMYDDRPERYEGGEPSKRVDRQS